jgi:hypothetical protein
MNTRLLVAAATVALGLLGSGYATRASACSDLSRMSTVGGAAQEAFVQFSASINASPAGGADAVSSAALVGNGSHPNAPIVGFWKFTFTAPDGVSPIDWGFQQWHNDGTEITNSGGRPPASGNFCLGVWKQRGGSYQLNHWAIAWGLPPDFDTSSLTGLVNIRELVDVDQTGNHMTGTVSLDLYSTDGTTLLAHLVDGTVAGTRIKP